MKRISAFLAAAVLVAVSAGCSTWQTTVRPIRQVGGLGVTVEKGSGVLWRVTAVNNSSSQARLVWDESTYVATNGVSSRLVRGQTRVIHSGQVQPPSPIPPGATLVENFLAESQVQAAQMGVMPAPADPSSEAKIYLVFEIDGRKRTYEAGVTYSRPGSDAE